MSFITSSHIYFQFFVSMLNLIDSRGLLHCRLTCIYASCKVEENHVSAEELGKGIQQDHQVILNNEMVVLQVLALAILYL